MLIAPIVRAVTRHAWLVSALLGALAIAIGMAKYGLGLYSGWPLLFGVTTNLEDPHAVVDQSQDYLLRNASLAALLGMLGVRSSTLWLTIHVLVALAALMLPFLLQPVRRNRQTAMLVFIVIAGGPVLPLLLEWIGSYDAVTVLGLMLVAVSRDWRLRLLGWTLIAFTHSELGVVAFIALLAFRLIGGLLPFTPRAVALESLIALPALALGWVVTGAMVANWGGATSRVELFTTKFGEHMYLTALMMPMALFTCLAVTWFLVLQRRALALRSTRALIVVSLAVAFLVPLVAIDHTRIAGMVLLPLALTWVLSLPAEVTEGWGRIFGPIAAVLPVPVYLAGITLTSGLVNFLIWRMETGGL